MTNKLYPIILIIIFCFLGTITAQEKEVVYQLDIEFQFATLSWVNQEQLFLHADSEILVYELNDLVEPIQQLSIPAVLNIAISANGHYIAFKPFNNKQIEIWDVMEERKLQEIPTDSEVASIQEMLFIDSYLIVPLENIIRIWEWQTGSVVGDLEGHETNIDDIYLSSDGFLYSVGSLGPKPSEYWRWDLADLTGERLFYTEAPLSQTFSSDASFIVLSQIGFPVTVQDLAPYGQADPLFELSIPEIEIVTTQISSDDRWLLGTGYNQQDIVTPNVLALWWIDLIDEISCEPIVLHQGIESDSYIALATFSPDSSQLATIWGPVDNPVLEIWDLSDAQCEK